VAEAKDQTSDRSTRRRTALIAVYVAAAGLAYGLGAAGLLPYGPLATSTSTPLSRIGFVLQSENPRADAASWARLREDVALVRADLSPPERDVFDLVTALRGLDTGGKADLQNAARSCQALRWPRCDDQALEAVRQRTRP
jgi:hypothetical protein